jgi:hypothetical protein
MGAPQLRKLHRLHHLHVRLHPFDLRRSIAEASLELLNLAQGIALECRLCRLLLETAIPLHRRAPVPPLPFLPPGSFLPFPLGHRQIQLVPLPFHRFGEQSTQDIDFRSLVIGAGLQFLQRTREATVTSGE